MQETFGQKLVGLTFNPSGDPKVQKAKELCAELADLLNEHFEGIEQLSHQSVTLHGRLDRDNDPVSLRHKLFDHAIGEILNAQMNVVKVLTFKH